MGAPSNLCVSETVLEQDVSLHYGSEFQLMPHMFFGYASENWNQPGLEEF
jgi:hypothetical protein